MGVLKRLVLGRPLATESARHHLLPKLLALPVFASDALSSNAYATEEILHELEKAGRGAMGTSIPIALAVAVLLIIVVTSYRQTVKAYPRGGGSYVVSKENLGILPGLVAGASLLTDYVLTVAVSIAAGTFAITSLVPDLAEHKVSMAIAFIAFITLLNLRGLKESGTLFAIPTYGFVLSVMTMLAVGFARCFGGTCPAAETAGHALHAESGLGFFLILTAFSRGATALTGVEAIADGVPAFQGRRPAEQARNAATTLAMLGGISITLFLGLTILASRMDVAAIPERSVVAQIANATFSGGIGFGIVQVMTALILILAANTAYQDFPRLSSILAKDRFMPRQFINRGDRLVFSNGIVMLAALAGILIVIYDANVQRLIGLYVWGVFTSFTLSQAGMVVRWRQLKPPGWKRQAIISGIGAATTGLVLVVVTITKFATGVWIVMIAVGLIVVMFKAIHRHYASVGVQLRVPEGRPRELRGTRALLLVARVDTATMRALGYARSLRPLELRALHVGRGEEARLVQQAWEERRLNVPLEVIEGDPHDPIDPIRSYIRAMDVPSGEVVTTVMPEVVFRNRFSHYLRRRRALLLKASLLFERRVVLTDYTVPEAENQVSAGGGAIAPTRVIAIVLVSAVHNATLRALEYARSLRPTDLRAVTFNVDPDETEQVLRDWAEDVADVGLEAINSPYREVTQPLLEFARSLRLRYPDATVSVILPEFVVRRYWHQFLHNQTALAIKGTLLFEPGVVVTSVPFHLE